MQKFLTIGWISVSLLLFLYSFTQVDLSLTLSQISIWQAVQKSFQQIGYFNRPLSTAIFLIIISAMFALYLFTLIQVRKGKLSRKYLFGIILVVSAILFFSYNAFSYDLFNYMFDAKIFTHYFQNPYFYKALDFPEDPMLTFMHWTHRTYPYGPTWLLLTIPISFIGFGYFLLTFYLFKLLSIFSLIFSAFLIEKIAEKLDRNALFAVAVFALNPLVIIESLVSSHLDIVMIFFALTSLSVYLEKKYAVTIIWLIISAGIKFATVLMIPAFLAKSLLNVKKETFLLILIFGMILTALAATYRTTFQPWYLLIILPFSSLLSQKYYILIPTFVMSAVSLLQYAPFLYLGNWDPPVPEILNSMLVASFAISFLLIIVWRFIKIVKSK